MKIVSQLLSATPSADTKTGASPDNGADFRGSLTAATAQATGSNTPQIGAKPQREDAKSQTADVKKKFAAPGSAVAQVTAAEIPSPNQNLSAAITQFASSFLPIQEAPTQSSDGIASDLNSSGDPTDSSSAASISPLIQASTNPSTYGTEQLVAGATSSFPVFEAMRVGAGKSQGDIPSAAVPASAANAGLTSAAAAAVSTASPSAAQMLPASRAAGPAVGPVPVAVAHVVSGVPVSQSAAPRIDSADTSNSNGATPTVDSTPLTTQQTATPAAQSTAAPISIPGLSILAEPQSTSGIAASLSPFAGRASDTIQGAASRETSSAIKGKPAPGTSAPGNRFADSSGTDTQTGSLSTTVVSEVSKAVEAPGGGNQGTSEPRNALDVQVLPQMTQAGLSDGANHVAQSSQGTSAPADAPVHTLPAQAPQDSQPIQAVSSAQLIQSMHSSEMKLGIQSAEFGNISISTSLNHQTLSAQISMDHAELGRALAVHLPAIEEKLGSAYGVQAKVELRDTSNPSPGGSGYSSSGQQAKEQRQFQGERSATPLSPMLERIAALTSSTTTSTAAENPRLDIRI